MAPPGSFFTFRHLSLPLDDISPLIGSQRGMISFEEALAEDNYPPPPDGQSSVRSAKMICEAIDDYWIQIDVTCQDLS